MANINFLDVTLSQAEMDKIQDALKTVSETLPFLVNLTNKDRIRLPKMGDKSIAFVDKTLNIAENMPELVPSYIKVDEFQNDIKLFHQLSRILYQVEVLKDGLSCTKILAGSEAYTTALALYNTIRTAQKSDVPGVESVYEELAKRFPGRSRKNKQEEMDSTLDSNDHIKKSDQNTSLTTITSTKTDKKNEDLLAL